MVSAAFKKLGTHKDLIQIFWSRLDDEFCEFICGLLSNLEKKPGTEMLQVHAEAGAYAGLALGLQVVLAAVLMPLVFRLL